jgi:hypothetical protein
MVQTIDRARVPDTVRRIAASLAAVAAAAGLIAFAHLGAFHDGNDPFQHSVVAPER